MPDHLTTVLEIREAGIVLPSEGTHVVRVLSAAKEVPNPTAPPPKEALTAPADRATYEAYYAGTLMGAEEAAAEPGPARVPALFVDTKGRAHLLRRR